jgi:Mg-chelatase subunit ChlD
MFSGKKLTRRLRRSRHGAIVALVAVSLPMLVLLSAYAVDVAYMEIVRAQLRISTDSAAKAALVSYGSGQTQAAAITFAQTVANNNLVANQTVPYSSSNLLFGSSAKNGSGVYVFTSGGTPTNSVQATGTVTPTLLIGAYLPVSSFTTQQVSVATRISHDIVLVLDRSASMAFDLSANEFSYPSDVSGGTASQVYCYFHAPSATASRWSALTSAVNSFINTLTARNLDVHVALVTYAETYSFGNYSAAESTLDVPLTSTFSLVTTAMNNYGNAPLLGDTNIAAGLATAQTELTGSDARTATADRTIILLTDGVATQGNMNIASLTLANRQNSEIVTHVITFGGEAASGSVQTAMQNAAQSGNGNFYNAPTAATLTQAFQDIADSLPAVLVQ